MGSVDAVDRRKIGQIGEKDGRLDDVPPGRTSRLQDRRKVIHHALGLDLDGPLEQLSSGRIQRNLPAGVQKIPDLDGL